MGNFNFLPLDYLYLIVLYQQKIFLNVVGSVALVSLPH